MTDFTLTRNVDATFDDAVAMTREALSAVGFGVLTEIDIAATLKAKLDVDVAPKLILGACRPQLAHQAITADARVTALLPCNVVITAAGDHSVIDVLDPMVMPEFTGVAELTEVATDARDRLMRMLDDVAARARSAESAPGAR